MKKITLKETRQLSRKTSTLTPFGTEIVVYLEEISLYSKGDKNFKPEDCYHHLIMEISPRTDTNTVTTVRINTIEKADLKRLAKMFTLLANEL